MTPHFCDAFFSEAIFFHEPQNYIVHILDKIQLFGFVFKMSTTVIMGDASVNSECIRRRKPRSDATNACALFINIFQICRSLLHHAHVVSSKCRLCYCGSGVMFFSIKHYGVFAYGCMRRIVSIMPYSHMFE